LQLCLQ